ncbi:helix-turn-helix domain-containing protein [Aestuariimicrobium soli]|uniref:helix-turn-helix domain-containing protein n=1 Tax=Aestuariimicrobium soli TaxID=2035834 RepID=UPI003EBFF224
MLVDMEDMATPEGRLIKARLDESRTSQRALASKVDMSEGRVRQIIKGYQSVGGQRIAVSAPAETIMRLALELDITPDELRAASRDDAADLLQQILDHRFPRIGERQERASSKEFKSSMADVDAITAEMQAWLVTDTDEDPPSGILTFYSDEQLLQVIADRLVSRRERSGTERIPSGRMSVKWTYGESDRDWYRRSVGREPVRSLSEYEQRRRKEQTDGRMPEAEKTPPAVTPPTIEQLREQRRQQVNLDQLAAATGARERDAEDDGAGEDSQDGGEA